MSCPPLFQRVRKAQKFGIPLVSEGLVVQSLKAGKLVDYKPFLLAKEQAREKNNARKHSLAKESCTAQLDHCELLQGVSKGLTGEMAGNEREGLQNHTVQQGQQSAKRRRSEGVETKWKDREQLPGTKVLKNKNMHESAYVGKRAGIKERESVQGNATQKESLHQDAKSHKESGCQAGKEKLQVARLWKVMRQGGLVRLYCFIRRATGAKLFLEQWILRRNLELLRRRHRLK